jgi:hypothetical protein
MEAGNVGAAASRTQLQGLRHFVLVKRQVGNGVISRKRLFTKSYAYESAAFNSWHFSRFVIADFKPN